jgi:hypothetical protein
VRNSIEIEGREFISAKRASEIARYSPDYIGQLCRAGSVNARMLGRSWYIELQSILEHKRNADLSRYVNGRKNIRVVETASGKFIPEESAVISSTEVNKIARKESPAKSSNVHTENTSSLAHTADATDATKNATNASNTSNDSSFETANVEGEKKPVEANKLGISRMTSFAPPIKWNIKYNSDDRPLMPALSSKSSTSISNSDQIIGSDIKKQRLENLENKLGANRMGGNIIENGEIVRNIQRRTIARLLMNTTLIFIGLFGIYGILSGRIDLDSTDRNMAAGVNDALVYSSGLASDVIKKPIDQGSNLINVVASTIKERSNIAYSEGRTWFVSSMRQLLGIKDIGSITYIVRPLSPSPKVTTSAVRVAVNKSIATTTYIVSRGGPSYEYVDARFAYLEQSLINLADFERRQTNATQDSIGRSVSSGSSVTTFTGTIAFSSVTATPTTLAGYGITDFDSAINTYVGASTTIAKLYEENVFSALQTFSYASTTAISATTICLTGDCRTSWPVSGGGGEVTWATTTSSVGGQLVNYSNSNTDIIAIGSNSTTTAKIFFDPNTNTSYFNGSVGIGTTSPYAKLAVDGRGVFNQDVRANYFTATSTSIASTFPYASTTALSATTLCLTSDCRTAWPTVTAFDWLQQSNIFSVNSLTPSSTLPIWIKSTATSTFAGGIESWDKIGAPYFNATSSSATSTFAGGLQAGGSSGLYVLNNGNVGIGTVAPSATLHIAGSLKATTGNFSGSVWMNTDSYFYSTLQGYSGGIAKISFNPVTNGNSYFNTGGNVGIGTTSPYQKLSVAGGNIHVGGVVISTSTTASSVFPYASTTALSATTLCLTSDCRTSWPVDTTSSSTLLSDANNWTGSNTFNSVTTSGITVGSLNGPLQANNGVVSATTSIGVIYGGTGANSFTGGQLVYGSGTGALSSVATGTISSSGGISVTANRSVIGGALSIACDIASASQAGCISSTDWSTFNSKVGTYDWVQQSNVFGVNSLTPTSTLPIWIKSTATSTFAGGIESWDKIGAPYFNATSTTATSTFAGGLQAGGSSGLYVLNNGNVGIGTATPVTKLDVNGSAIIRSSLRLNSALIYGGFNDSLYNRASLQMYDTDRGNIIATPYNGLVINSKLSAFATDPLFILKKNGSEVLQVNSSGSLGIGTTSPFAKLSISANALDTYNPTLFNISSSTNGTATTSLFTVLANGNVGIGIENPNVALQVAGAIKARNNSIIVTDGTDTSKLTLDTNSTITANSSGGLILNTLGAFPVIVKTNSIERLRVDSSGNLGIGTTSPYAKLSVVGEVVAEYFHATSTTATSTFAGGMSVAGTNGLTVLQNGYVGIGRSDPSYRLDVVGGVRINRALGGPPNSEFPTLSVFEKSIELFRVNSGGLVGIGTTSPYAKLSVQATEGDSTPLFTIASSTNGAGTTTALYVAANGNVGVGTANPTVALQVNGDINVALTKAYGWSNDSDTYIWNGGNSIYTTVGGLTFLAYQKNSGADHSIIDLNGNQNQTIDFRVGYNGGTSLFSDGATGNVGIGTTSPYAKLSVVGQTVAEYFTATSTTATSTFPNLYVSNQLRLGSDYITDLTGTGLTVSGGALSVTGLTVTGGANMLASFDASGSLVSTSTPQVAAINATSTTATSTFAGGVRIGGINVSGTGTNLISAGAGALTVGTISGTGMTANISSELGSIVSGTSEGTDGTASMFATGGGLAGGKIVSNLGSATTSASGTGSIAWGSVNSLLGSGSILSSGIGSVAFGSVLAVANTRSINSTANGSFAAGYANTGNITASGDASFAFGDDVTASASLSTAFGSGFTNNVANSFMVGYGSTPTLTVNSTNVGIGTTSPYAKLVVNSFGGTQPQFVIASSTGSSATSTSFIVDRYGNVGIGTATPNNTIQVVDLIDFNNTDFNSKIGYQAGKNIVSGAQYNTFLGYQAGLSSSTASTNDAHDNTAIGYRSLYLNTIGERNSAIGSRALYDNTTGSENSVIGYLALSDNTTGWENTAIGSRSLYYNTSGDNNTAIGSYALYKNTAGDNNIAIGSYSGYYVGGSNNVMLGYQAGSYETGTSTFYVDAFDRYSSANDKTMALLYGTFDKTSSANQNLTVNAHLNVTGTSTFSGLATFSAGATTTQITSTGSAYFATTGGNVGIGTTSPQYILDVQGASSLIDGSAGGLMRLRNKNDGSGVTSGILFANGSSFSQSKGAIFYQDSDAYNRGDIIFANNSVNDTSNVLVSDARMIIKNTGNVGIGTSTPDVILNVVAAAANPTAARFSRSGASGNIEMNLANSDPKLILWSNFNGSGNAWSLSQDVSVNSFIISNSVNDPATGAKLTIDSSGNVGIGTTSPWRSLSVQGSSDLGNNALAGTFTATSTTGTSTIANSLYLGYPSNTSCNGNIVGSHMPCSLMAAGSIYVNKDIYVGGTGYYLSSGQSFRGAGASNGNITFSSTTVNAATMIFSTNDLTGLTMNASSGMTPFVEMKPVIGQSGTAAYTVLKINSTESSVGSGLSYLADFQKAGTSMFNVTTNGSVGIGTTSPYAKLSVENTLGGSTPLFAIASSTNGAGTTTALYVAANGKVGIGTTNPVSTLDLGAVYNTSLYTFRTGSLVYQPYDFNNSFVADNSYYNGTSWTRINSGYASGFQFYNGQVTFFSNDTGSGNFSQGRVMKTDFSNSGSVALGGNINSAAGVYAGATMVVLGTGNVGIGTTSPYAKLSVDGRGVFNQDVRADYFTATSTTVASTFPYASTTALSATTLCLTDDCRTSWPTSGTGGGLGWASTTVPNSDSIYSTALSNVGIGTTSPFSKLSVSTSAQQAGTLPLFTVASTTGATLLTVLGNGNVGVGTAAPEEDFHLSTDPAGNEFTTLKIENTNTSGTTGSIPVLALMRNASPQSGYQSGIIQFNALNTGAEQTISKISSIYGASSLVGNLAFYTSNSGTNGIRERMRIDNLGNVGIGTTSPYAKLSVVGPVVAEYFHATSTTATSTFAGGLQAGGTSGLTVLNNGMVGIGTTNPSGKFEIIDTIADSNMTSGVFKADTVNNTIYFGRLSSTVSSSDNFIFRNRLGLSMMNIDNNNAIFDIGQHSTGVSQGDLYIDSSNRNIYLGRLSSTVGDNSKVIVRNRTGVESFVVDTDNSLSYFNSGNVGIGTTTPWGKLSITQTGTAGAPAFIVEDSASPDTSPFIIDQTGNVGIGTANPAAKLEVSGAMFMNAPSGYIRSDATTNQAFYAPSGGFSMNGAVNNYIAGNLGIGTTSPFAKLSVENTLGGSTPLFSIASSTAGAGTTTAFYVAANGNVGIGTTNPSTSLQIGAGTLRGIAIGGDYPSWNGNNGLYLTGAIYAGNHITIGSGYEMKWGTALTSIQGYSTPGDYRMEFKVNSNTAMKIASDGNVGIGTTSPYQKLSVAGGNIHVGGVIISTSTTASSVFPYASTTALSATTLCLTDDCRTSWPTSGTGGGGVGWATTTASNESVYFYGTENVGIGTTSPYAKLSISNSASTPANTPLLFVASTTGGVATTTLFKINANGSIGVGNDNTTGIYKVDVTGSIRATTQGVFPAIYTTVIYDSGSGSNASIGFGGANKTLTFNTDSTARMFIGATGNIGIGTTTPQSQFVLSKTGAGTVGPTLTLHNSSGNYNDAGEILWTDGSASEAPRAKIQFRSPNIGGAARGVIGLFSGGNSASVGMTETLTISSDGTNGLVGIGTTSPYAKLSVVGPVVAEYFHATSTTATSTFAGGLVSNGMSIFDNINIGAFTFDTDAGVVSWADLPISSAAQGTAESYTAQLGGLSVFTIYGQSAGSGEVQKIRTVIGTSTETVLSSANIPYGSLLISDGALCVDNGAGNTCATGARTRGYVYAEGSSVAGLDIAEQYQSTDITLEKGDILMVDPANPKFVTRYDKGSQTTSPAIIGIVSTEPGVLLGGFSDDSDKVIKVPVALAGRVPLKVNLEGGPIAIGDRITISSVSGIGTKAVSTGYLIGTALDPLSSLTEGESYGIITVFVDRGFYEIKTPSTLTVNEENASSTMSELVFESDAPIMNYKTEIESLIARVSSIENKLTGEGFDSLLALSSTTMALSETVARLASSSELISTSTLDNMASSTPFIAKVAESVLSLIRSAGQLVIDTISARLAVFDRVEVNTASIKTGMEIVDQATGDTYCVTIKNGDWDKKKGLCEVAALNANPTPLPTITDVPQVPTPPANATPEPTSTSTDPIATTTPPTGSGTDPVATPVVIPAVTPAVSPTPAIEIPASSNPTPTPTPDANPAATPTSTPDNTPAPTTEPAPVTTPTEPVSVEPAPAAPVEPPPSTP